jgi:hypothetical protein
VTEFQALIVGAVSGALMKHSGKEGPFLIDIEVQTDREGNYSNKILVTGRESGEELLITVDTFGDHYDTPETVAAKAADARRVMDAAREHLE